MIAYVILRPDGTPVEVSVSPTRDRAWWWLLESLPGSGMHLLQRLGYRLHSFEVPLPAPKAQETEHP